MATKAEVSEGQVTVLGLIGEHGHEPAGRVAEFVRFAAAAQAERFRTGAADFGDLTRSTALWAIGHVDPDVAERFERGGLTEADLGRVLSLPDALRPAEVDDVAVHEELARALVAELAAVPALVIDVVDIAIAILRDVEANGGLLAQRLTDVGARAADLLAGLEELRSADGGVASGSAVRHVRADGPASVSDAAGLYLRFYEALRAGGQSDNALWSAFGLVATRRGDTLASVVVRTVLRLRGERASRRDPDAGLRAFGLPAGIEPVAESAVDLADHPLLASAGHVRDQVQPDEIVRLRHLVAVAVNDGSGPLGPATRDRDVDAVRAAVLDQLAADAPPQVAAIWRDYLARTAAAPPAPATEPEPEAAEAPAGRPLAGLDVDLVDDGTRLNDELHTLDDVVTLCDMLAARDAVPPISVGLFGKWGSGKSYFMALMRRRIDELRGAAVDARARGRETSYCPEIVQITFNAWHYMDADDLWATLAVHLFGAIAQVDPDDDRARPRADVVRDLAARERQMEPVDRKIARALGDRRLDGAAASMGLDAPREDVLGLVRDAGTTIGYLAAVKVLLGRAEWTSRRRRALVGVAGIVAVVAVLAGLMISGTVSTAWLLAWIPLAGTVAGTAARWLRGIRIGLAQVNQVAAESGLQPRDVTHARIEKDAKIRELRAELESIDQLTEIRDWVRARALSTDYTSHFGVISVLRGDLEALVDKQRRDAPDRRIILYIDDLDRCPPSRVVEVLQAVHLLLAFPLFVAVVGVDPRWLLRSLERHYRRVLSASDNDQRAVDDLQTATTPHDYLEKIFQIPFALRRMDQDGYGRLVASLTGAPATGSPGGASAAADPAHDHPDHEDLDQDDDGRAADVTGSEPIRPAAVPGDVADARGALPDAPAPGPGDATPAGTGATGTSTATDPAGTVPLAPVSANPPQLRITPAEVATLAQMGPLIPTPRAAKRLVNLYRLIRAGLADDEIDRFVGDADFRPLAIVLAIQVGHGPVASALLAELTNGGGDGDTTISTRVTTGPASLPSADPLSADWDSLRSALRAVCIDDDGHPIPEFDCRLAELRRWMPRLRRYSFEGALGPSWVPGRVRGPTRLDDGG